jgi:hypothetical protein
MKQSAAQSLMFKLYQDPKGRGLRCDPDGLFLAGEALLERDEECRFRPRSDADIRKILDSAYGAKTNWESRIRSVSVVAKALNNGDIALAMMAALLMRMPEPGGTIRIVDVDGVLAKAGFDPDEPRDERGRWVTGGENNGAHLVPAQAITVPFNEPLIGPLIEEVPAEPVPLPPPTDVVPPMAVPRGLQRAPASNPYPNRRRCAKEWSEAEEYCKKLRNKGLLGSDAYRGQGKNLDQCVRGQVSAACGGNPTAFEVYA